MVGGGPAGAAAAIVLARAGADVVLVDKARFPRDKCCGDGLTVAALRELQALGLEPECVAGWRPVYDVHLRSPSGRVVDLPLPRDGLFAVVAPRSTFDAALLDLARAAGAKVLDGHALRGASLGAGGGAVVLEVDGLDGIAAPYVIGADGAWSPLRKALGAPHEAGYLGDWHAFRQYFTGCGPQASDLWVWFDPDLLPGYAWSFPLPGGRANVGFGLERNDEFDAHRMGELWPELLRRPHIRHVLGTGASPEGPHKAWPIPARVRSVALTAAGGRALFVGDAACATDPLTGEGIAQALLTGRRAAEAILAAGGAAGAGGAGAGGAGGAGAGGAGAGGGGAGAGGGGGGAGAGGAGAGGAGAGGAGAGGAGAGGAGAGGAGAGGAGGAGDAGDAGGASAGGAAAVARRYERAVRQDLFADHWLGDLLSRGLSHRKGARLSIRAAGLNGWTRRNFGRWLFEDYPRAALLTPRRWSRRMFSAPGAYRDEG